MQIVRFLSDLGIPTYGWVFEDKVGLIEGDPIGEYRRLEALLPYRSLKILAPVSPSKVICIGRNYKAHADEHHVEVPNYPLIFLKPPSSIIGPDQTVYLPSQSAHVEHEAELAVVVGKPASNISADDAVSYVFGYTIANDVTARDLQRLDGQWTRAKGFDTFCPIGPWIETEIDPYDLLITCKVNGEVRQMGSTRDMVFHIGALIAYISSCMTLLPGDVILTGTPAGVGILNEGDVVNISIDGIGGLRSFVKKKP